MTTPPRTPAPRIGRIVDGYAIPVINERAVRAAAGILFLLGATAVTAALLTGTAQPIKPFGIIFIADMYVRVTAGDRFSPALALGRVAVRNQTPEWVGAPQKRFAWWLGFAIALASCTSMGLVAAPLWVTLTLCSICLTLLFAETAFGICVGCALQARFGARPPQYCPGGSCEARGPKIASP